jgi:rhodanese-related sulfurtransferase
MTKVTVEEVAEVLERKNGRVTIVDARSADAWNDSDVKAGGAVRIPPDEAEKHIADVRRDDYIVVYCT